MNSPIIPPKKACKWGNFLKNRVSCIWREPFRLACKWKPCYAKPCYAGTRCSVTLFITIKKVSTKIHQKSPRKFTKNSVSLSVLFAELPISGGIKALSTTSNNANALKVGYFQKKIGFIYRLKQICRFTILNSSFEFSCVFCKFLTAKTLAQLTLKNWEEQFFKT